MCLTCSRCIEMDKCSFFVLSELLQYEENCKLIKFTGDFGRRGSFSSINHISSCRENYMVGYLKSVRVLESRQLYCCKRRDWEATGLPITTSLALFSGP